MTPDISIANTVTAAIAAAAGTTLLPKAITMLSAFMTLQFVITHWKLLFSGDDMGVIFAKLAGYLAWGTICFYLMFNGPAFIDAVGTETLTTFGSNLPSPGSIITSTLSLSTLLLTAIAFVGTTVLGNGNTGIAQVLVLVLTLVFSVGMYMSIKVMMLSLELGLTVVLAPLSFSYLGLNALRDQGIAPFKSLISLMYRIVLLGFTFAAFKEVIGFANTQLHSIQWTDPSQWGNAANVVLTAICAFPMIAVLAYKSDSIAANLASGSTSMGAADVAGAAAAGAAAGAAANTASGHATGTLGAAPRLMRDIIGAMRGGGSIANASGRGTGGGPVGTPPPKPVSSLATGNSNKPPVRPTGDGNLGQPSKPPAPPAPATASPAGSGTSSPANTGDGSTAGIGGSGSGGELEKKLGQLVESMSQPKKPSLRDHLGELNRHVANESAATHVSINGHAE